jgi:hypothetical protein
MPHKIDSLLRCSFQNPWLRAACADPARIGILRSRFVDDEGCRFCPLFCNAGTLPALLNLLLHLICHPERSRARFSFSGREADGARRSRMDLLLTSAFSVRKKTTLAPSQETAILPTEVEPT